MRKQTMFFGCVRIPLNAFVSRWHNKVLVTHRSYSRLLLGRLVFHAVPLFMIGILIPLEVQASAETVHIVQQNTVQLSGTVKDTSGETVIGANVTIEGTTIGTITDFEGNFTLNVPDETIRLKVTFIGYQEKIVTVKQGTRSVQIQLAEDAQLLDEVQVVAYGAQKKSL